MTSIKVTTVGNTVSIVLPEELLKKLAVSEGDQLLARETPDGIEILRGDASLDEQMKVAEDVMRDREDVLRRLAE